MATRHGAGIVLFRRTPAGVEVLIGHRGGPDWAGVDDHAWSIPKGGHAPDDDPFEAALREFEEEVGLPVPTAEFTPLGTIEAGKLLSVWAAEGDVDETAARSVTFELEWPPGSGRRQEFLEFDRVAWVPLPEARRRLVEGQVPLLDRLEAHVR